MIEHAKNELEIINHHKKNEFLNILKIIDEQGHSNTSINFIRYAIKFNDFKTYNNEKEYEEYAKLIQLNLNEIKPLVEVLNDEERKILLKLIEYKPLSPLEIGDDQWRYSYGSYSHKRFNALCKNKLSDRPRYLHAVVCDNGKVSFSAGKVCIKETGTTYLLRKAHPKKYDEFPTVYIKVTEEDDITYTTEKELDKVREFYDLEEVEIVKYVVVAGTRTFSNYDLMCEVLDEFKLTENDFIISGCAKGADTLGERYSKEHGIKLKKFPADWKTYGKKAGYIRNKQMAEVCSHGVVFWDGISKGSKHMINLLKEYNKEYKIIKYSE